jgi:hypothetical protein
VNEHPHPILDRADLERFFAQHFGNAQLLEHLVADLVMEEAERRIRTGEPIDWHEFPDACMERIEATLLALVEAESAGDA